MTPRFVRQLGDGCADDRCAVGRAADARSAAPQVRRAKSPAPQPKMAGGAVIISKGRAVIHLMQYAIAYW